MEIITSHLNADFDSLGAMIGAKKLYPQAVCVFPGSQEKTLRKFFVASSYYVAKFEKAKNIDLNSVTRLILVDTAQPDRIGRFRELLDKPDVEVVLFDHHHPGQDDIVPNVAHLERVGAATTILVEQIKAKRIPLDREEASIMLLGIYEDTGGLTFTTTTPRDMMAAAYLLSQNADLSGVTTFLPPELTTEQVGLLDELLKSRTDHKAQGVKFTLANGSCDRYMGDLAGLIHRMRDMENLDVIIAYVRMDERIYLVARSRLPQIDVSLIAKHFGGGGHPEAASATIKELTPIQVRKEILELIPRIVHPTVRARDIWTSPVKTIEEVATLSEAQSLLNRYQINVLPVMSRGKLVGLVTRLLVERAVHHGLADTPVTDYMISEFDVVSPTTGLDEVRRRIIEGQQRFLPVVENGLLKGGITRTDFLRSLDEYSSEAGPKARRGEVQVRSVARLLKDLVDDRIIELLRTVGCEAAAMGAKPFLVGGMVRDLLMRRENLDVDVVVEGDGIGLAEALGKVWDAQVRPHRRFGTAKLILPDGFRLDIATARTEFYAEPGALPSVEEASLKLDLSRRDFTVNTLAMRLDPDRFGEVIDFFGGFRDLKDRTIRILHNLSFVEDPTRVLRALRFQLRFDFDIGPQTQKLLTSCVKEGFMTQALGPRLFGELMQLYDASDPVEVSEKLAKNGVLAAIHPKIKLSRSTREILVSAQKSLAWFKLLFSGKQVREWFVYMLCLFDQLDYVEIEKVMDGFGVAHTSGRELIKSKRDGSALLFDLRRSMTKGSIPDSRIYAHCHGLVVETVLFAMSKTRDDQKRRAISRYYTRLEGATTTTSGNDLKRLGIPPGPIYGKLLEELMYAKLDGKVKTAEEERNWVLSVLREGGVGLG